MKNTIKVTMPKIVGDFLQNSINLAAKPTKIQALLRSNLPAIDSGYTIVKEF